MCSSDLWVQQERPGQKGLKTGFLNWMFTMTDKGPAGPGIDDHADLINRHPFPQDGDQRRNKRVLADKWQQSRNLITDQPEFRHGPELLSRGTLYYRLQRAETIMQGVSA